MPLSLGLGKGSLLEFAWTEEQAAFRREVIRFAQQELNERLIERDLEEEFSWDAWKKCAKFGIQGLPIPEEYGGGAADILTTVCGLEALGYGCRDNGLIFALNAHMWSSEIPLLTYGTPAQKKKYLANLVNEAALVAARQNRPAATIFSAAKDSIQF